MEVTFREVSKAYRAVRALDSVSCRFAGGKIFGLLGPNGAGKTTLIRVMMDIIRPDSGALAFDGHPLTDADKRRIGYLPEERGLYKKQKIHEVLEYLGMLKGLSFADARRRVKAHLERFEMLDKAKNKVEELSKGNQQKIQIIGAVLHEPEILVLDEPFSGLDPVNTRFLKDFIVNLKREGRTVVLSTHQMNQVEEMCDELFMVNYGRIVLEGAVAEVKRRFADRAVWVDKEAAVDGLASVARAETLGAKKKVYLNDGEGAEAAFLREALAAGVALRYFETASVPLEEIFIRVAKEKPGESHVA